MKFEVLVQNVLILMVIAIVLEACVMAIYSLTALKDISETRPAQVTRDVIVIILSLVLCYKVPLLSLFAGTGIKLSHELNTIISALVLMRLTNLVGDFFNKLRRG